MLMATTCTGLFAQNTLKINGGNLVMSGTSNLVLNNTQFINDGTFSAGSGTVSIEGDGSDAISTIGGTSTTVFHNLKIDKSANGAQLGNNIEVENELQMTSGNLNLNGNNLNLATSLPGTDAVITGESATSRITGPAGGEVIKTIELDMPSSANPGNMGFLITSSANLGSTEIRRGHVPETVGGNNSIARYFTVTPATNANLNATIRFQYFDEELNGNTESALGPWRKDNSFWFNPLASASDASANYIESANVNLLSRWTLAPGAPQLAIKVFLQGPFQNTTNGMGDDLRNLSMVSTSEPYAPMGFNHVSSGGGETIASSILDLSGTGDVIVDWVFVELRDSGNSSTVVAARSALLQKDGDIVDLDGVSPLSFPGIAVSGSYFVAVWHRNHLAMMTTGTVGF